VDVDVDCVGVVVDGVVVVDGGIGVGVGAAFGIASSLPFALVF